MGKFTKSTTHNIEFDGDTVTVVLTRMKRKDAMKLMPFIQPPDADGKVKMIPFQDQMKMLDVAADILPKYITRVSGLMDLDTNVELDTKEASDRIVEEAYYMGLIGELIGEWVEASFLFEGGEKKLEESPESTSPESEIPESSE